LLLHLGARCAAFLETGRNDNCPFYASLDTLGNNTWHGRCGRDNDSEIDLLRQGGQVGVSFDAQDASALGIDGKNRSPKWIADQVPEDSTPDASYFFRRPNYRDALRLEDGIEGMALLVAKNSGGGYYTGVESADDPLALFVSISLQVLSCN
jgi:hypothetical protein